MAAHALLDLDVQLAVRKTFQYSSREFHVEFACNLLRQLGLAEPESILTLMNFTRANKSKHEIDIRKKLHYQNQEDPK